MRRLQIKFPNQIRISGWDFGSSARAMNQAGGVISTQADLRTVRKSTTERKSMSTKTTIKRVALVAVAALGFGMLSSVPSQAYTSGYSLTVDANDTVAVGETATATITQTFYASSQFDSVTVNATLTSGSDKWTGAGVNLTVADSVTSATTASAANRPSVSWGGSSTTAGRGGDNVSLTNGTLGYANDSATVSSGGANRYVTVTYTATLVGAKAAGTYTVTFNSSSYTAGSAAGAVASLGAATWTVTVTATDTTATAASFSTLREGSAGLGELTTTDSAVSASKSAATTVGVAATIYVTQKNAAGTAGESLTATVSGPAYVSTSSSTRATSGSAVTFAWTSVSATPIYVWSTGTSGTATITVKTLSGVTVGTETVKFYGDVTKIAVLSDPTPLTIVRAGGYTSGTLFYVQATDANGVARSATFATTLTSASTSIASATIGSYDTDYNAYPVTLTSASNSVSGGSATLTFRVDDPATTAAATVDGVYLTATQKVTLGGSVATEVITLDKASYEPGEGMVITITAKDASGNPVYDGAASPALTSTKTVGGTMLAASTYAGGKVDTIRRDTDGSVITTNTVFAPAAEGSFTVSRTTASTLVTTTNASADVVGASAAAIDAANEATDAANAATDAANAAAEAADAATAAAQDAQAAVADLATQVATFVAGIKAQITSLTNLVIKIQKKVKA
jgi:trimeric autotransporter adhesin